MMFAPGDIYQARTGHDASWKSIEILKQDPFRVDNDKVRCLGFAEDGSTQVIRVWPWNLQDSESKYRQVATTTTRMRPKLSRDEIMALALRAGDRDVFEMLLHSVEAAL